MTIRLAINGFGRIGRNVFRALIENPREELEIVAVNTIPSLADSAYLLEFDSVHGRLPTPVSTNGDIMEVGSHKVKFLSERNPENLDWSALNIDVVLECTGIFTDAEKASVHLAGGAKKGTCFCPIQGRRFDSCIWCKSHSNILRAQNNF